MRSLRVSYVDRQVAALKARYPGLSHIGDLRAAYNAANPALLEYAGATYADAGSYGDGVAAFWESMPSIFTAEQDFEGASPLNYFDAKSAGQLTVEGASAKRGSMGLTMTPSATTSFVRLRERLWSGGVPAFPYWSLRFWWRMPAWPSTGNKPSVLSVVTVGGVDDFTLFHDLGVNDWLKYDLKQTDNATTPVLTANQWYLVEAKGSFAGSTWTADVRLNGVRQPSIATTGKTPEVVHNVVWGPAVSTQTFTQHVDDIAVAVGSVPLPFLGAT
jgi:hypothetical protein